MKQLLFLIEDTGRYQSIWSLLGLIALFLVVIVACYFATRFVGGKKLEQQKNSNFVALDTYRIAQNRYLQLVQIGTRYFVIAIGKDSVNLISELQKEEITFWRAEQNKSLGFQEILSAFRKKSENDMNVSDKEGSDMNISTSEKEYSDKNISESEKEN